MQEEKERILSEARKTAWITVGQDEMNAQADILVVDDDEFIRGYVSEVLLSAGYSVTVAANGHEALEILASGPTPGLLFTDVQMAGGMSGIELARRAKLISANLRVLYTSGYIGGTGGEQLPAGAEFLRKPFRRRECIASVRAVLSEAAAENS